MSATTPTAPRSTRVPGVVLLLAAVTFCLGTSEFMIAGLLEQIAADLHVSIPQAGLLITAFAVGMVVGAPAMAVLTLRLPTRSTLVLMTVVFAAAHVLGALAPGYGVLLVSRVLAAVACGGYWSLAAVHAHRASPPGAVGRSLAALVGGLTIANLVGVPGGAWLGERYGWRSAFWVIAVVTALAAVLVAATVRDRRPAEGVADAAPQRTRDLLARELGVFRTRRIWLALATTALFQASVFAAFSYFSPLLTKVAGLDPDAVPLALVGFGVGAFVGVTIGGRIADRNLWGNLLGSLVATAASLLLLAAVASVPWAAFGAVLLVGMSGFSIAGALNARVFQIAAGAPTLAASMNTAAFNVGNAVGPALGGAVIALGLGYRAPLLVGVVLAAGALATTVVAMRRDGIRVRRGAPSPTPAVTVPADACCAD
ncbi:MFS transporter [Luteimicrobium xylanilyticum]|uniref:Putative MFS-type transporter YbcL n=1 Tax=Luteimicrobium xylanilyticum TaxID=1133546 RepID=A0A5P9QEE8_9MICO|nr:Cmx/CmrA family chloramphenicol efflux MFS transporter [Luteimicrobium xylanilyticum]QFU99626.1 putative MFS-type transporter YbcL [Luteimicrobium xylanilyticum]